MEKWNAEKYLLFENERTQPAIDLAAAIHFVHPLKIIDIGCGPGNSTEVLARMYPNVNILGIDNSEEMIDAAAKSYPGLAFQVFDAGSDLSPLGNDFDVVFSNACIQWIPDHKNLLPQMFSLLSKGGILAVQVPMIWKEPIHEALEAISSAPEWIGYFQMQNRFYHLKQAEYCDILDENASDFRAWETIYIHRMKSHKDILEWYRSTGLRPYLGALPEEKKVKFENEFLASLVDNYPKQKNGEILFRFPRFFFAAMK